ncbi:MAG: hypothetical protein IJJ84_15875 [Kiritimatiellae bacterium]|nr:hypothetical protein [Kiritimatiellia bacterium]
MTKLMTMIGVAGLAFAATAAIDDALLAFSTVGPDKYADGTTVLDGECYALVWTANGATFGGIAADGTPVAETDKIVLLAPVAKGGRCPNVLFQIDSAKLDGELKDGTFGVYLLDTRVAADGAVKPAGVKNGKLSLVNGYGLTTKPTKVGKASAGGATTAQEKESEGGQAVAAGAAAPKDLPQPKITSIKIEGDYVKLTVQNLPGFMRVSSGAGISADDTQGAAQATDGKTDEVILYAPKTTGASGFFKVIRN